MLERNLAIAGLLGLAGPVAAQDCRLALVLALDVSGSVSATDNRLQHEGLARALLAPEVTAAFLSGAPVALHAFEWSGTSSQAPLLPGWQLVRSEEDLTRVAIALGRSQRVVSGPEDSGTAVGAALAFAAATLAHAPDCQARTVDISGDGMNSEGIEPRAVIESLYDGITVNALVIEEPVEDPMLDRLHGGEIQIVTWFSRTVLNGPGAFTIVADGFEDYERAMTAKLRRELEVPLVSGWPTNPGAG